VKEKVVGLGGKTSMREVLRATEITQTLLFPTPEMMFDVLF